MNGRNAITLLVALSALGGCTEKQLASADAVETFFTGRPPVFDRAPVVSEPIPAAIAPVVEAANGLRPMPSVADARTPAIAICLALLKALRALESKPADKGDGV